jgi:toxin ParE1/3/4
VNTYSLTPEAEEDLEEITDYFSDKSPKAGRRVLDKIEERCHRLAQSPRMGTPRGDLGTDIRSSAVPPYVIFFRPVTDGVQILRILHGARDIDASLFTG